MQELHQFMPSVLRGDAVGEHARLLRQLLVDHGLRSWIYAAAWDDDYAPFCRPFESYEGGPAIYQLAVGSGVADFVLRHVDVLAVNSHNVTPPRFFAGWGQPAVQQAASWGERQLASLAAPASLGIAVSSFNAEGLRRAGFRTTEVVPLLADLSAFDREVDEATVARLRSTKRGADWLFVGRLVPNKAQHDLVRAFAEHRASTPGSRLWLVGRTDSPRYEQAVRLLVDDLGLDDAVTFTGAVDGPTLGAYYRAADVFVSASEHEGFCLPLLEALHCGLPVVAHASSAVMETLGDAGACVADKGPRSFAGTVEGVLRTPGLARPEQGEARVTRFALDRVRKEMWVVVDRWLGSVAPGGK